MWLVYNISEKWVQSLLLYWFYRRNILRFLENLLVIKSNATSEKKKEKIRLKKKIYVSKLPRAFVFRCVFDLAKFEIFFFLFLYFSLFIFIFFLFFSFFFFFFFFFFFCLKGFFFHCFMKFPVKILWKDMKDTIRHFGQQISSTLCFVLYLVHRKIKFHISY